MGPAGQWTLTVVLLVPLLWKFLPTDNSFGSDIATVQSLKMRNFELGGYDDWEIGFSDSIHVYMQ